MVLTLLTAACDTQLTALNPPPGGFRGELDENENRVTMSPGVALAFRCTINGSPCGDISVEVDDPRLVTAERGFLDELSYDPDVATETPSTSIVIVARRAGVTTLRLSGAVDATYEVEVVLD
ncbi:MAG: hypothetical protein AAGN82_26705 [Myxococcota bacterium]